MINFIQLYSTFWLKNQLVDQLLINLLISGRRGVQLLINKIQLISSFWNKKASKINFSSIVDQLFLKIQLCWSTVDQQVDQLWLKKLINCWSTVECAGKSTSWSTVDQLFEFWHRNQRYFKKLINSWSTFGCARLLLIFREYLESIQRIFRKYLESI